MSKSKLYFFYGFCDYIISEFLLKARELIIKLILKTTQNSIRLSNLCFSSESEIQKNWFLKDFLLINNIIEYKSSIPYDLPQKDSYFTLLRIVFLFFNKTFFKVWKFSQILYNSIEWYLHTFIYELNFFCTEILINHFW